MHYVQINLGRNVNGQPMSELRWLDFQFACNSALFDLIMDTSSVGSRDQIEIHNGVGHWGGSGGLEESVHMSTLIDTSEITGPEMAQAMTSFTRYLRELAADFQQEAIAVITGSRLIKPKK